MMRMKSERRERIFPVMICTLLAAIITITPAQAVLTRGHQVLLNKGLQIETLCMPSYIMDDGGTFDLDLYKEANFTTINLWNGGYNYDYFANTGVLPSGNDALPYSSVASNGFWGTAEYSSNLVRLQYGDEQDLVPSSYPGWADTIAMLKSRFPNTLVYMNNDEMHYYSSSSLSDLTDFVQAVRPDMLSFTCYPFRWQDSPYYDYEGGSPTMMYKQIELYRKAGLAGLGGDGSHPIPVSMFVQTFAHVANSSTNHRQPTESEFRLQQFAGWASGMKAVDSFIYGNVPTELNSMFFEGTDAASQTPTAKFYQYAELNRQSANLGPALVQLISTDFRMKMGSHGTGDGVTNTLPYGVSAFDTTTDPYLTGITATNLGTCNNGLPGDVLYGAYKPLEPFLVEEGCEDDVYFMIVNGLSDSVGDAADCAQLIQLTFDFGDSGIDSLLRLSRDTGLVEEVVLTQVSDSLYSLDLTLDGGTGDLFKYNTGSAFIGVNLTSVDGSEVTSLAGNLQYSVTAAVPEPSVAVMAITALLGLVVCVWRKRK